VEVGSGVAALCAGVREVGEGERLRTITVAPGPHRLAGVDVRCWEDGWWWLPLTTSEKGGG
jgi:hypothetical protein